MPVSTVSAEAASTVPVAMTSLRASAAVAISVSDWMVWPMRRLSTLIHNLTRMETTSTAAASQPNCTGVGCSTLAKLSLSSSTPMTKIMTETASPARYSYRAWPYGWPESAGRAPSLKPTRLTRLELASERLFKPSAVMETLPASVPAAVLPANSSRLHTTLTMHARLP